MVINGSDLMVFLKEGSAYKSIAHSTTCAVTLNNSLLQVSSKDTGDWEDFLSGKKGYTVTFDAIYTQESYDELMAQAIAGARLPFCFSPKTLSDMVEGSWAPSTTEGWKGTIMITSVGATASDGEVATFSVSANGAGKLERVKAAYAAASGDGEVATSSESANGEDQLEQVGVE